MCVEYELFVLCQWTLKQLLINSSRVGYIFYIYATRAVIGKVKLAFGMTWDV